MKKRIPFPQANSLERIYNIFLEVTDDGTSKFNVIKDHSLAEREGAYYLDALYFLGMVSKYNTKYFLSEKGTQLQRLCKEIGRKAFAVSILEQPFWGDLYLEKNSFPDDNGFKEYVAQKISNQFDLGIGTARRRASTVMAWFLWIENNVKES